MFYAGFEKQASPFHYMMGGLGAVGGGAIGNSIETGKGKNNHRLRNIVTGAVTGGALGTLYGHRVKKAIDDIHKAEADWGKYRENFKQHFHDNEEYFRRAGAGRASSGLSHEHHLKSMGMDIKDATSKEAVKRHWKAQAFKHHPDRGGDINKMKDLNTAMDKLKSHSWYNKLPDNDFKKSAFVLGFEGELCFI